MTQFQLSDFFLDLEGNVQDNQQQPAGTWTTSKSNQLVIKHQDGSETVFDTRWKFNEHHQLCLLDDTDKEVFNFHTADDVRPKYQIQEAVLWVIPKRGEPFKFSLRGDWSLNENHQMIWETEGHQSILDGILSDRKSRFNYRVRDLQNPRIHFQLIFAGKWEQFTDEGIPKVRFLYKKEQEETGLFLMPKDGKLVIENGMNQFRYVYDKEQKTFGITLLGFLKITENLEIVYTIDRQQSSDGDELISKTVFTIQAAFEGNQFEGNLGLVVLNDDLTPGNYQLTVTGDYTGVIGATRVMVGFRFSQRRNNRMFTQTFGIGGAFMWENGIVHYRFDVDERFVELEIGFDIKLKHGGSLDSKFCFRGADGEIRTITFLMGITF